MLDVIKPHHVSLCVLLRAFLDSDALEVCRTGCKHDVPAAASDHGQSMQDVVSDEGFQSLGDFLLLEIRARSTVKYPSLTELLLQLQVKHSTRLYPKGVALFPTLAGVSISACPCCTDTFRLFLCKNSTFSFDLSVQQALPSKDTGDQIASLLMEQLGGLQYPDDLVTFFSDMSQLMHSHASSLDVDSMKGGADISSAMGFYIRHCCVSFHMLAFEVRSPLTSSP